MPTYNFIDTVTGEEFESFMKIAEREEYLKENPHIQPVLTAPHIVSGVVGIGSNRVPNGFKEVLSKVAEAHPTSRVVNNTDKNQSNKLEVSKWLRNTLTALPKEYKADEFKNL